MLIGTTYSLFDNLGCGRRLTYSFAVSQIGQILAPKELKVITLNLLVGKLGWSIILATIWWLYRETMSVIFTIALMVFAIFVFSFVIATTQSMFALIFGMIFLHEARKEAKKFWLESHTKSHNRV